MLYLIDFDSRSVESKGEDGELLAAYVLDNDLTLAVALVDSSEELALQFSLNEIQDLYNNLADDHGERARDFDDEETAVQFTWEAIENNQSEFPKFTQSLGKKLIRAANKGRKDDTEVAQPKASKPKRERKAKTGSRPTDASVVCLGTKPRESTMPFWVWCIVDDNLGELSIGEIVAERGDWDEGQCRKQITRCLRKGFLILQQEEEL